jgi:Arc/MetJ-type ribon-helix-helix transcriptional regulator
MATKQINVRIPAELIEPIDERVWRLRYPSRNAFLVQAIERALATEPAPDQAQVDLVAVARKAVQYLENEAEWRPVKLCKSLHAAIALFEGVGGE